MKSEISLDTGFEKKNKNPAGVVPGIPDLWPPLKHSRHFEVWRASHCTSCFSRSL